jgi:hypothetical protein
MEGVRPSTATAGDEQDDEDHDDGLPKAVKRAPFTGPAPVTPVWPIVVSVLGHESTP